MRACVANHKISEILRTNFFFPNFAVLLSPNMFRKRPFPDTGMAICLFLAMTVVLLIAAPYRIGFKEQIGIFYWADDRLSWYLSNPAVAASIIGDWLTQFYYSNTAGVLITVLLLALLWMEIIRLSRLVRGDNNGVTVTVLPVLVADFAFCAATVRITTRVAVRTIVVAFSSFMFRSSSASISETFSGERRSLLSKFTLKRLARWGKVFFCGKEKLSGRFSDVAFAAFLNLEPIGK